MKTKTLPFELYETDHGIDGWDAKTVLVARFSDKEKAQAYLAARGFDHVEYDGFWHRDPSRRHTMNAISYAIRDAIIVPENPTP